MKQENKKDMENNEDKNVCRALITPSQSDEYDFEAVAVPAENGQMKYSYKNDEYFNQVLRTGAENVDTSRLESGIPLFDNHPYDMSAKNTLGITVSYMFDNRGLVVRCKLGARADEALRADIKSGIIKTVSIEGTIQRYIREQPNSNEYPTYYGDFWTPESLSFAPVPNDIAAQIEVKRAAEAHKSKQTIINNSYTKLTSKF